MRTLMGPGGMSAGGLAKLAVGALLTVVLMALLQSLVLEWAWNTLMPPLFHVPQLTLGQVLAATILLSLVQGGLRQVLHR